MTTGSPRLRQAARAVVVDPQQRVLLVRFAFGDHVVWATPGGGLEADEDAADALRRELAEEVGLVDPELGPEIWERTHHVPLFDGAWDGQHERYFLVTCAHFEPCPQLSAEQLLAENVHEQRWWTLDELDAFAQDDHHRFAPTRLPELTRRLLADGPPAHPLDTGV